jgi:hypothetical protein
MGHEYIYGIQIAQNRVQWWAPVNTVLNIRATYNAGYT